MADQFIAEIQAQLNLSKAESQWASFQSKLQSTPIKIKAELDGIEKSLSQQFSSTGSAATKAGAQVGINFQRSIQQKVKSYTFDGDTYIKKYIEQEKKNVKESEDIAKRFNTSQQTALKAVKAKNSAEVKADNESITQQKKLQKELDATEKVRLQSIENARKREDKITSQQNKAINKSLENDYKQQLKEAEETAKQISKIQDNVFNGSYNAKSSSMTSKLSPYVNQNSDLLKTAREQAKLYDDTLKQLSDHFDSNKAFKLNDDEVVRSFGTMDAAAKKFENTMTQVQNTQSKDLGLGVAERSANSVKAYYEANSNALKKYGAELKDLENRYRSIKTVEEKATLDNEFKNLKSQISAEGLTGKSLWDDIKRAFSQISQFTGIYALTSQLQQVPQQMIKAVYDVDTAMTNLYKVTEETDAKYQNFLSDAGDKAQDLGRDMSSLITQTSEWAKLGFSLDEAANLSEVSSIYANVAEVDDATAVSDLVTAMKAFNIEASDSIEIADSLNALGNKFATSSADLGEGLSKSASAMKTAGSDMHETLAMLTGGAEITQSAGEFGNFLKVASMRIRGMKGELEQLGEEVDESVDSISKVQTQILNLTHGQVNIFDSAGEFRDYYKIMEDIASIHDDLSSTEQATLDEILFGKQRANQGAALIQAFQSGQIQKALLASQQSAGSAQEEQDRWMESMEAKIGKFQAAFQQLSSNIISSDFLKAFVNAGTDALNIVNSLTESFGGLNTVIGVAGGIFAQKTGLGKHNVVVYNAPLYKAA